MEVACVEGRLVWKVSLSEFLAVKVDAIKEGAIKEGTIKAV